MERQLAAERIKVIKERYEDHIAIAGKTTDMLDDFGFLIEVADQWLAEGPVQMAVPRPVVQEKPPRARSNGHNGADAPRPKATRPKRGGTDSSPQGWSAT